ncbi:MAG: hypothetical protein R2799_10740 [Crocinitomicaceae bacterium]
MIHIIENTLRDGSYTMDFQMTAKHTEDITRSLAQAGFEIIEVGHGLGLGAYNNPKTGLAAENDEIYIRSAKAVAGNAKISAFFIPGIGTKDDMKKAADNGLDVIRIGINVNEFNKCREYAEYAKELGMFAGINMMKSYAVKSYEFSKIVEQIDQWNLADVIYLVDSAGCMTPEDIDAYLKPTSEHSKTALGFHGHNNLSLAAINSVQAVKSGATYIDSCIRGMGRSAGNAQTEILIILLQKLGFFKDIDIYELYDIAEKVVEPIMWRPQGMTPQEIQIGYSKFHSSYTGMAQNACDTYKVDFNHLIKSVSDINCLNPSQELFNEIAKELK